MVRTALLGILRDIKLFLAIDAASVASSQSLGPGGSRWDWFGILFVVLIVVAGFTIFAFSAV